MLSLKLQRVTQRAVQFDSASAHVSHHCALLSVVRTTNAATKRRRRSTMLIAAARHAARRLSAAQQSSRRRCLAVQAVNLDAWLKEHGPTLKPPVANKLLFGGDLKVMVVGGPNQRRDYHLQEGEEFFAQLEGTLTLKTIERGSFKDVRVTGGDCFLLPSRVPHSPQREAASLGLVFERSHVEGEMDGMLWFDEGRDLSGRCDLGEIAYEAYFFCSDLGKDLKPVIEDYGRWKDAGEPPRRVAAPPLVPDDVVPLDVPQPLQPRLDGLQPSSTMLLHRGEEVIVEARVGVRCLRAADAHTPSPRRRTRARRSSRRAAAPSRSSCGSARAPRAASSTARS